MILVDTSVLSRAFRRSRPGEAERRIRAQLEAMIAGDLQLGLPGPVLQEVLSGIRSRQQFDALHGQLVAGFAIISPGIDEYVEAARLRNRCIGRGVNVSGPDCLIAQLTIAGGHELYTEDADFAAIAGLSGLKLYRPAA